VNFSTSREKPSRAEAVRDTRDRDVFGILLVLYSLILYPILRADRYYNDDLKRALVGRAGWDSNGRPLTTLVMRVLQGYDHAMVDISPLPQIGAIALLAWVGVLMARRYSIGSSWMAALVAFPLGAQPFYLENLSFKFDALSMSLAMLLAVLPMLQLSGGRRAWWLGVLALWGSLCFYQPAINAYLVFVLVEWVCLQLQREQPSQLTRKFIGRFMQFGMAMLLYYLLVGIHVSGWVKHASERIHGWRELPLLLTNFVDFYGYVGASFNGHWWMYFGPLLTVLALFPVVVGIRYALAFRAAQPARVTVLLGLAALLVPLAALVAALGPMLLLHKPENRHATVLVQVEGLCVRSLTDADLGAIGFYVGTQVRDRNVAVTGLTPPLTYEELKYLVTPMAVSGAVALCHVVGVTPEAPTLESALGGQKPQDSISMGERQLKQASRTPCCWAWAVPVCALKF